jgi:hypothetical protein
VKPAPSSAPRDRSGRIQTRQVSSPAPAARRTAPSGRAGVMSWISTMPDSRQAASAARPGSPRAAGRATWASSPCASGQRRRALVDDPRGRPAPGRSRPSTGAAPARPPRARRCWRATGLLSKLHRRQGLSGVSVDHGFPVRLPAPGLLGRSPAAPRPQRPLLVGAPQAAGDPLARAHEPTPGRSSALSPARRPPPSSG